MSTILRLQPNCDCKFASLVALVFVLIGTVLSWGTEVSATPAWTAKPGVPPNPVITAESWNRSPFKEFYEKKSNWDSSGVMSFVEYNPSLPRILLIGDSISMGYTLDVRQMFRGKANVYRILGNGGDMTRFLANYEKYLGDGTNWDLIHFNWGLHDVVRQDPANKYNSTYPPRFTETEYAANLEKCVAILKSTGAHLVWASTTPVPSGAQGRITGDEVARNAIAARIMNEHGIVINDLYTLMHGEASYHIAAGNVHFNAAGYLLMARQVGLMIQQQLGISANPIPIEAAPARLVNHWRLDGNFREEISDQATVSTTSSTFSFVDGVNGPALKIDGSSTEAPLPLGAVTCDRGISIAFGLKLSQLDRKVTLLSATRRAENSVSWQITLNTAPPSPEGRLKAGLGFSIESSAVELLSPKYDHAQLTVGEGKRHYLVFTVDRQSGVAEIYIDGTPIEGPSVIMQNVPSFIESLELHSRHFSGWIDELQIWDGALTGSQVGELSSLKLTSMAP